MNRKNFNMRLPQDLENKVIYLKEKKGIRISFIVENAVREYFERNPNLFDAGAEHDNPTSA